MAEVEFLGIANDLTRTMYVFFPRPLIVVLVTWRERLRTAVQRSGQKHSLIALDAGVTPETLSRILNEGHQRPSLESVTRIAHAVNENVGWLLDERGFVLSGQELTQLRKVVDFLNTALLKAPPPRVIHHPSPNAIRAKETIAKPFAALGATRCFQITDDSMIGAAIADGDLLFVRPSRSLQAAAGRVIVCRINGGLFAKQLDLRGGRIRLLSRNDSYAPMTLKEDELKLIGVVVTRAGAPAGD